jgi:DNA-binding NarL/FixJ family response regulator
MRTPIKIRVLIAHSDPLIATGLTASLREHGLEVSQGEVESVGRCGSGSFPVTARVAVADYEAGLRLLGARAGDRDRVMILTHRDGEAEICNALEKGADGYLLHGCSVAEIIHGLRLISDGGTILAPLVANRVAERMKQQVQLTSRELDILRQMMFGLCNKQMATMLKLAVGTVKTHVKSVLRKLGAANRTHAVAVAQRRGIVPRECAPAHPVSLPISRRRSSGSSAPEESQRVRIQLQ